MAQTLTIELSDEAYGALERRARALGASPGALAAEWLQRQCRALESACGAAVDDAQAARNRFERHFGEVDLGHPTGVDNESIDADLAREYASNHEGD